MPPLDDSEAIEVAVDMDSKDRESEDSDSENAPIRTVRHELVSTVDNNTPDY
jgi:hypothetical protein